MKKSLFITVAFANILVGITLGSLSLTLAGETENNAAIAKKCGEEAKKQQSHIGGIQVAAHCQQATYYRCLAKALCQDYPDQCEGLRQRKIASCKIITGMKQFCDACM